MRNLVKITVQPSDLLFTWTLRVQLTNFRKHGFIENYRAIVWIPFNRLNDPLPKEWKELEIDFPEVKFFYYFDKENYIKVTQAFNYIPLLRPHCLRKHFEEYPELKDEAIFYIDADVILTKPLDLSEFLQDDVCYMSQAGHYINADYFDSKIQKVLPEKLESYKKIDVLDELSKEIGINRKICEDNNNNSGAAQYLLKNIDAKYWAEVESACMVIIIYLGNINRRFFISTDEGYQKWCADIWAVIWNLWKRDIKTECPKILNFAWATDRVDRWDEVYIYHDAGATPENNKLFYKRALPYVNNITTPFEQDLSYVSPNFCSYKYVQTIQDAKPNKNK